MKGAENFDANCEDCEYRTDRKSLIDQFIELELEAESNGTLIESGSVACRGVRRFIRTTHENVVWGIDSTGNTGQCGINILPPEIEDPLMIEKLQQMEREVPRPLMHY